MKKISRRARLIFATGLSLLCLCYILWTVWQSNNELRAEFLFDAEIIANKLNEKQIEQLSFSLKDRQLPEFEQLKRQLQKLAAGFQANWRPAQGYINIYTMRSIDGVIRFGPESLPENDPLASPPGTTYKTPPSELQKAFATRKPMVVGPFHNEQGSFITALVPLHGSTETNIAGVDISADNWKIAVLQKAVIPVGITLILLIVTICVMYSLPRIDSSPKPVMQRLLPPLTILLILLFGGALLIFLHQYRDSMTVQNNKLKESITSELLVDQKNLSNELSMALRFITSDPRLQQALRDGNREQLLSISRSLFDNLSRELKIYQFYFFDRSRRCILRVHDPDKHGDMVDRFTLLQAERTGKTASGLELGSRGIFALRVVQPVIIDGVLLGYIELDREINDIFESRHISAGIELIIMIRKEFVKRQQWEAYMRQMGRKINWNQLPDSIIIYNSGLPETVVAIVAQNNKSGQYPETGIDLTFSGKNWHTDKMPLLDVSGKNVGSMLIVHNITEEKAALKQILLIATVLTLVILTAIFGVVFVLLRRTDIGIDAQHKALQENEEKLRTMVNTSPDGITIVLLDGTIDFVSEKIVAMHGYTKPEEMVGRKIFEFIDESCKENAIAKVGELVKGNEIGSAEYLLIRKDGTRFFMEINANMLHDEQGNPDKIFSIGRDITERKLVDEKLRESEALFRNLFDSHAAVKLIIDHETGSIIDANQAAVKYYGWTKAQLLQMKIQNINTMTEEEIKNEMKKAATALKSSFEFRHRLADGSIRDVMVFSTNITSNGKECLHSIIHDISERKKVEDALAFNHAMMKTQLELSLDGILVVNEAYEITSFNTRFLDIWGIPKESVIDVKLDESMLRIITAQVADVSQFIERIEYIYEHKNENIRDEFKLKNGKFIDRYSAPMSDSGGKYLGRVWFFRDITERKLAAEALSESNKRFEVLAEQAGTIVWELNNDGLYTFISPLAEKLTGYSPDEITGKLHFYDLHPEEGREEFKAAAFAVLEKQEQIIEMENPIQTKDGRVIWIATNALPQYDVTGKITGYRGSDTDITERKNTAVALQASEEKWRTMIDTSPDGVTILSFEGTLLFVSEKMVKMLGYARAEEIVGRNMSEFLDESHQKMAVYIMEEIIKGNHVGIIEFLLVRKDGTRIFIEVNPEILHDNNESGNSVFFAARDITERKKTETQLRKLSRTYALQSDINANILHENEPQVLFENICRIAVTTGGFHMAWLSMIDPESGSAKAVASAGNTGNYLEKFNLVPDGNSELSRGPTANALFSGKCSAVNDIEHDPRMTPWRENALRLGYRSAAVFPLNIAGKVCGTLNLYSSEVNFFDADELKLLNEIANELAFAIDYNESEKKRKQVVAELQETKALLQAAFDQSLVGIAIADASDGNLRYVNNAGRMIRGESKTEIVNNLFREGFIPSWQFQHHDGTPLTTDELPLAQAIKSGKPCQSEYVIVRNDGGKRTVQSNAAPIFDDKGKIIAGITVFQDITMQKQAEQAMAEHTERLDHAVKERTAELQLYALNLKLLSEATEQSPTAVIITDVQGNINFVNPRFTEMTGYTMEEVVGQNPRILKSGQTPPTLFIELWQTILSGKIWRGEFCNRKKNGNIYWEKVIISPVRNERQEIINFVAVKEDITQERKIRMALEYAEERNRLLLESAGVGIFGVDPEGKVIFINSSACQMFGCEPKDLLGEDIHEKIHHSRLDGSPCPVEECPMHQSYTNGIKTNVENEVMFRRDKEPFYVDYHATPIIKDGVIVGAVISFQDVSERKKAEEELATARRHADDAHIAKSQFLANMSHEIRTPMNAILGMTYLALETELTPKQQDYLQKINIVAKTLLKIISDVLDFSKIESGMLEISTIPFMIEDVIRNSAMLIGFTAEEKGIAVEIDIDWTIPYMLNGDPTRLGQILNNLLSNAVKFTSEGEILLSVQAARRIQNKIELEFSVKDTGIGIAPENKVKLFKSFTQADESITRQYGGTGLGLAISRQLLGLMGGGEIQLESTPGKGSIFSFKVIFSIPPNSKPAIERLQLDSALRGTQTLLVSTNETSCNITRKTLEAMRLKTATASSAVEAFEKITDADKNNTPFGLIIIDWWPSGIDEIETARHIRQMHLSNSPRLVLISSRKHELDEATVHDAGFSICINRPVHPSMLFNAIMQAFHSVIAPGKVPAKRHKELKDVKILLAEDNEFNRQVELELLQGAGAIVSVVYNGREAVEAVKTQDFDLVLMDVQMPEMDGLTATRNIRKLDKPGIATLPILAMTANVLKQDIDDCLAAGMNDHITKPIDPAEMLAILSNYITPKNGAVNKAKTVSGRRHDENVVLPHSRPELDVAIGLSHTGGSKVFYRDMLRKFIRDFASSGTVISADLKSGKKQDAMRIAHTVKSAAGTIGALKLFAAAMELENTLHSDSSTAAPSLNRFKAQLKELVAILRNEEALHPEKDSATKTPSSPGDLNYLKKAITELEVLAEKRLPLPCREVMDSLLAYEWPVVYVTLMHDIKNMFARYRFDEVLVKLEELHKLSEQKNNLMEEDSSHDTTN